MPVQWKRVIGRRRPAEGAKSASTPTADAATSGRDASGSVGARLSESQHQPAVAGPPAGASPAPGGRTDASDAEGTGVEAATPAPPSAKDLIALAEATTWTVNRPHHEAFHIVVEAVSRKPAGRVIVVGGADVEAWTSVFEQAWPDLRVYPVRLVDDESEAHVRLTLAGPFDVVVDASDESAVEQAQLFRRVFMHLDRGGSYIARRLVPLPEGPPSTADPTGVPVAEAGISATAGDAAPVDALPNENIPPEPPFADDLWTLVSAGQAARTRDLTDDLSRDWQHRDVFGLAGCLVEVHVHSKVLRVVNGSRVSSKLREEEVDAVLAARPDLGERMESLPAVTWTARNAYRVNRPDDPYVQNEFRVPDMTLRRYDAPICSRGQLVTKDHLLFPESFRQNWMERMANVYVVEKFPRFGLVRRDIRTAEPLPGAYFHFDSEWPGHFGHLLTEQLSRLWAFDRVRELEPDVKLLMTLQHDREPAVLHPFEVDILGAFGIAPEEVHVFTAPCRPERLYAASGMFSLPRFVHPEMAAIWDRVGDHLVREAPDGPRPERLFVSRRPSLKRSCHNVADLEEFFAARGYAIFHPEEHPLSEQVAMFRAARHVAGFAGSGLFTLALCRDSKSVVVLAPDSYTARNENLIAAVRGHSVVAVRSRPDEDHPENGWNQRAFASSFTFDFTDEGRFLTEQLEQLEHPNALGHDPRHREPRYERAAAERGDA